MSTDQSRPDADEPTEPSDTTPDDAPTVQFEAAEETAAATLELTKGAESAAPAVEYRSDGAAAPTLELGDTRAPTVTLPTDPAPQYGTRQNPTVPDAAPQDTVPVTTTSAHFDPLATFPSPQAPGEPAASDESGEAASGEAASSEAASKVVAPPRPGVRVGTVVWGLILAVIGAGVLAVAAGAEFDLQLVAIGLLALGGIGLLAGSIATSARRRPR